MGEDFTMWSNLANGILAFSCSTRNSNGDSVPVKVLTCAGLKLSLVLAILFILANVYQIVIYYTNHRKKLWKTRQRIIYLNVIYIICSTICLSIVSVLGLFHLMFFFQQALFLQVLAYLIKKIEKLTMGDFINIAKKAIYILIILLFACLGLCLSVKLPKLDRTCPGMLETHGVSIKTFVLSIMMGLFMFGTIILTKLLARQHKSLFDQSSLKKRDTELLKLKFAMIVIVTAEAVQLFISIYHLTFPNQTDACATIEIKDSPTLESIITVLYRFIGYAMPVFVILWLIWVRKDPNRSFSQPYEDAEDASYARFASTSSLSFYSRSPTKYTMSESFLTQYRVTRTQTASKAGSNNIQ